MGRVRVWYEGMNRPSDWMRQEVDIPMSSRGRELLFVEHEAMAPLMEQLLVQMDSGRVFITKKGKVYCLRGTYYYQNSDQHIFDISVGEARSYLHDYHMGMAMETELSLVAYVNMIMEAVAV